MKFILSTFSFFCAFAAALAAEGDAPAPYSELDSALSAATETNLKAASARRDFMREMRGLRAMRESLAAVRDAKKRALENLKTADAKTLSECSVIAKKISADEAALAELGAFLDKTAESLASDPELKKILSASSPLPKDFRALSADEKMRLLAAAFSALRAADSRVVRSENSVSTGVFVSASGECSGDVAVLRVEKRKGANEK